MAIVSNWANPLKDSVLKLLSKPDLTYLEFEKIRQTALLLDGSPVSEELAQRMAQKLEYFEKCYQSALEKLKSDSRFVVEDGIQELALLEGYKDCSQKIAEGHANVERLKQMEEALRQRIKKRNTVLGTGAVIAAALAIIIFVLVSQVQKRATLQTINNIQLMVDAGQRNEAVAAITTLYNDDKTAEDYPELYNITEAILEHTASEEGYSAAFELLDSLRASIPKSINAKVFYAYADTQLKGDGLQIADKWNLLLLMKERSYTSSQKTQVGEAYLASLSAEEAGNAAILAIDQGILTSQNKTAIEAVTTSLSLLPPMEAWELAKSAIQHSMLEKTDTEFIAAFNGYVDALESAQAWSAVYSAYTNDTIPVSLTRLTEVFERYIPDVTSDAAFQYMKMFSDDDTLKKLPAEITSPLLDICMQSLMELVKTGEIWDISALIAEKLPWMDEVPLDPDTALQLVYTMDNAGYDVAAIFPDGIAISIPVADHVCEMTNYLTSDDTVETFPDLSFVLPIYIKERVSDTDWNDILSYNLSPLQLDASITSIQGKDSHYEVLLLPYALLCLPEDTRPVTYDQCTSLLCMQNTYVYTGALSHTVTGTIGNQTITSSTIYYPVFAALNMVSIYDLSDPKVLYPYVGDLDYAKVYDEEWFNVNQTSSCVTEAGNRFGQFDYAATSEAFNDALDNFEYMRILVAIFGTANPF